MACKHDIYVEGVGQLNSGSTTTPSHGNDDDECYKLSLPFYLYFFTFRVFIAHIVPDYSLITSSIANLK